MKKDCVNNILKNKDKNNNSDKINEENKVKENNLENNKDESGHTYSIFDLNYKTFLDLIK